jgi:hypothetical protein
MNHSTEFDELHSALDASIAENSVMRQQIERLRDEHLYFSSILSQSVQQHPALVQLAAARNGAHLRAMQEAAVKACAEAAILRNKLAKRDAALAASEERCRQLTAKVDELTQHIGRQFSVIQDTALALDLSSQRSVKENEVARHAAEGTVRELQASLAQMRLESGRRNEHIARLISENRSLRAESGLAAQTISQLRTEIAALNRADKIACSGAGQSAPAPQPTAQLWERTVAPDSASGLQ